ncbi:hypothetical protein PAMP_023922 [Pampus punctatissimus]
MKTAAQSERPAWKLFTASDSYSTPADTPGLFPHIAFFKKSKWKRRDNTESQSHYYLPALYLDSRSGSGSSCRAFPGPPSPQGSRGGEEEEEEEDEKGGTGALSFSLRLFFFQLTN